MRYFAGFIGALFTFIAVATLSLFAVRTFFGETPQNAGVALQVGCLVMAMIAAIFIFRTAVTRPRARQRALDRHYGKAPESKDR